MSELLAPKNASEKGIGFRIACVFLACLAGYFALYSGDRYLRLRKGPWKISFDQTTNGVPFLSITQTGLQVSELRLLFPGESYPQGMSIPTTVIWDRPGPVLPAGHWIFDDLMYLPGTAVFNIFGHGIQLLPRALTIDGEERPWTSATSIECTPKSKVPYPEHRKKR